jgi:uncharacterized Rmd1/YagE family protein
LAREGYVSTLFAVEAYAFASTFALRDVTTWLPADARVRPRKTQLFIEWSPDSVAVVFDFGALVFINVPTAVSRGVIDTFTAKLTPEPHAPLDEQFLIELRPEALTVEVTFDRVVVSVCSPVVFEVIATVIAQSVALDYYDEDAQGIMQRIGTVAAEIADRGEPRGQGRDLIRFAGQAIVSQVEIISAISLLDKPDATWEDELADRLHTKLRTAFEIRERHRAIEAKLLTIRESIAAFLDLMTQRRSFLLEAAIVALIAVEILMGLAKML